MYAGALIISNLKFKNNSNSLIENEEIYTVSLPADAFLTRWEPIVKPSNCDSYGNGTIFVDKPYEFNEPLPTQEQVIANVKDKNKIMISRSRSQRIGTDVGEGIYHVILPDYYFLEKDGIETKEGELLYVKKQGSNICITWRFNNWFDVMIKGKLLSPKKFQKIDDGFVESPISLLKRIGKLKVGVNAGVLKAEAEISKE